MRRWVTAAFCLLALIGAGCGSDGEDKPKGEPGATARPPQTTTVEGCREVKAPPRKPGGGEQRPDGPLASGKTYSVKLATSCGDFTIRVDQRAAPQAAASFVALARKGFFDETVFHRIVPRFVIQGGDPTASGTGGPGYFTRDVPPRKARYTKGVVAMAKTAPEPAGTAGSQFYVVTGADAGLPPEYAVLGRVTSGLDVVERIGELGDPASGEAGTPSQTVVLEDASVSEFTSQPEKKRKKKRRARRSPRRR
ncbi:MAG: peptidylprolyl isomerase [Actinomycetota bacterium]|nr:peptidylprolyl isomerase [Actinomycetota bacterium]